MREPTPLDLRSLYPTERAHLLALLRRLNDAQWAAPTDCPGWSVKDIALHLLAVDLFLISSSRDGFLGSSPQPGEAFVSFIDRQNEEWIVATRRLSTATVCDLLEATGTWMTAALEAMDLRAPGLPIS